VITLTHVLGTRLYQGERSTDPGFLTYYVSDAQVLTEDLPPVLTIDSAWSDATLRGYFLMLASEPGNIVVFAGAAAEHGFDVPKHASFAWVEFQQEPLKFNAVNQLDLKLDDTGANVVIATGATVGFGNYGLPFVAEGVVTPVTVANGGIQEFRFTYPLAYPPDRPPDLPPDLPPPGQTGVNVPLAGAQRYVLQSLALVGDFSNASVQGFDVGLRYFYAKDGKVLSQFYPIFATMDSGYQVEFKINWDPLNPKRCWMKFTGNAYVITMTGQAEAKIEVAPEANVLPSWLRTVYGEPLWLRPVLEGPHEARLVLQPMPGGKYYMVPEGDYELLPDPASKPATQFNLLCGLAGTESISFFPGTREAPATTIRFHPWMPAFAPVFPLTDATSGMQASGANRSQALADTALLKDTWTTAWVSIAPSGAVASPDTIYYAQPEQAALYEAKSGSPQNMLELFQAPVASFSTASLDHSFPIAIYAGLAKTSTGPGFPADDVRKFEVQILNRFRKETISGISAIQRLVNAVTKKSRRLNPEPLPVFTTSTTPQGLVAKIATQGTQWESVLLAQNKEDGSKLEFTNLPVDLREALQSNQLFLVASLAQPLGNFQHEITLAGWPFDIDVGKGNQPGDYRNVLIF